MRILVTGAAGFIGSSLCEQLLAEGREVVGLDSFFNNYPRDYKEKNVEALREGHGFTFVEADILLTDLTPYLEGTDAVFHLAARPGVRESWGRHFDEYLANNVLATQVLLEAVKDYPGTRVIFASSSSVYGDAAELPVTEETAPAPVSPYGATKLAAETLTDLYRRTYGLNVTVLRLFSVYGPRQRPDMAVFKFLRAVASGKPVTVYGDGTSVRDYTYISDAVDAFVRVLKKDLPGGLFNVASGKAISIAELILTIEEVLNTKAKVERCPHQLGDARMTHADTSKLSAAVGPYARTAFAEGVARQAAFMEEMGLL